MEGVFPLPNWTSLKGHGFEQFWYHNKLGDWHACQKKCSQLHGFEDETCESMLPCAEGKYFQCY